MRRLLLFMLSLLFAIPDALYAQDQGIAAITSPAAGEVILGQVRVIGSATHPQFARFLLEFAESPSTDELWYPVQDPITQQVRESVLGLWDTTALPDGIYMLRLRVFLRDGTFIEDVIDNIAISNREATPLPTIPPSPTPPLPTHTPTAGPSPTPRLEPLPTSEPLRELATPTPTVTPIVVAPSQSQPRGGAALNIATIQAAFCNGALIAFGAFLLLGLYFGVRRLLRPNPARSWAEIERELQDYEEM